MLVKIILPSTIKYTKHQKEKGNKEHSRRLNAQVQVLQTDPTFSIP